MVAAASRLLDAPPASITGGLPAAPAARRPRYAQVAQLVEHCTENAGVGGSIPPLGTTQDARHIQINWLEATSDPRAGDNVTRGSLPFDFRTGHPRHRALCEHSPSGSFRITVHFLRGLMPGDGHDLAVGRPSLSQPRRHRLTKPVRATWHTRLDTTITEPITEPVGCKWPPEFGHQERKIPTWRSIDDVLQLRQDRDLDGDGCPVSVFLLRDL